MKTPLVLLDRAAEVEGINTTRAPEILHEILRR